MSQEDTLPRLRYRFREVAFMFGVCENTVRNAVDYGIVKAVPFGETKGISRKELYRIEDEGVVFK